jgi:hypothetical protein
MALKLYKPTACSNHGLTELQKEIHIAKVKESIKRGLALQATLESKLSDVKIDEYEAVVNGNTVVVLQTPELSDGVFILKSDIDEGLLTIEDGYKQIAQLVDEARMEKQA